MNGQSYSRIRRINKENRKYDKSLRNRKRFEKKKYHAKKEDFYDLIEISRIEKIMLINHKHALERIEEYLKKYPNDHYAISLYSGILVKNRKFDEARMVLDRLENQLKTNCKIVNNLYKYKSAFESLIYSNIQYYLYNDDYELAFDCYHKYNNYINPEKYKNLYFYLLKKLNKPELKSYYLGTYFQNQILNYDLDYMRMHIKKHFMRDSRDSYNVFVNSFPIDIVLEEIKKYLVDENAFYGGLMEDIYFFKYDGCGKVVDTYSDYFKVVCYHGTTNIITMLPITEYSELTVIDLNYINYSINNKESDEKNIKYKHKNLIMNSSNNSY